MQLLKSTEHKILMKELKKSYKFFMKEINLDEHSKGYGLIRDKSEFAQEIASIASVGYGLAALVIGVQHNWIRYEEAFKRASKTLDTFLKNVEGTNGFFYHFINMKTGKREWNSELSIIDTGIFICGAITAGEYFGKEIKEKAEILYKKINWEWYRNTDNNYFYMGYIPEKGFWGAWDMYAEQLMLYVLGVSSPTFPIDESMYDAFLKKRKDYKKIKDIIYTYCGTLFTYQFSHAWIDFRGKKDLNGIDWYENSVKATKANRQYCIDNQEKYKTYNKNSWGLTACVGPKGYSGGYGAEPCEANLGIENDGTVAPAGAIGSIVFTPEETLNTIKYYYKKFPKLWGKYGFKDGFNIEGTKPWFSKEYIGIDKGIEIVMIENYLNGTIWKYFMKNKYVIDGLNRLGITKEKREKETLITKN